MQILENLQFLRISNLMIIRSYSNVIEKRKLLLKTVSIRIDESLIRVSVRLLQTRHEFV